MKLKPLDKASEIAIKTCMGTKSGETVLVISDAGKRSIGLNLFQNAVRLGNHSIYAEMPLNKLDGQEPPQELAELMQRFDVVFCPTSTSLTHTAARRNACSQGTRIATFPGITEEVMIRGLNADYYEIQERCLKVKSVLEKGSSIRVVTAKGTDISFSIKGRQIFASKGIFHNKGEYGNLPTGETFLAPVEGSAEGTFVVDGSMAGLGLIHNVNLTIEVQKGFVTSIKGGKNAVKLRRMLEGVRSKGAYNIAEFGIGTNHKAKLSGVLLEDEKVMGTIHIALGNNKSMGGSVDVPVHLDGVITKPNVYMDGSLIMKNGKLLIL